VKHSREAPDALRFHAELRRLGSVAACSALFKDAVAQFAIVAFACGEIDLADKDRNVVLIAEWPERGLRCHVKSGLLDWAPLVDAVALYREPFEFADLLREPRFSPADCEALRAAAESGWDRGLVAPFARGGTRFGLVIMIGRGERLDEFQRSYLCLIGECLMNRIHSLRPGVDCALPPAGMSRREVEAARLVALGCSDREIAAKLEISQSTAHKHVESGRKRLKARNRAHMAALSVSLGIATLG
jgi:DNA-binding CsgD family transcriptional regulator